MALMHHLSDSEGLLKGPTGILKGKKDPVKQDFWWVIQKGADLNANVVMHPFPWEGHLLPLYKVSMGNPHGVFINPPETLKFTDLDEWVDGNKGNQDGMNISFVFIKQNLLGLSDVTVRIRERGAGETLGCATGACAVTRVLEFLSFSQVSTDCLCPDGFKILMPGGCISIRHNGCSYEHGAQVYWV
jgi:diaminopimelate epimerase